MNEAFLNEVWTHVTTSLYAIEYWAYVDVRGDGDNIIEVKEHHLEEDGVPGESYFLNRHDLEKDLRKMYDLATTRIFEDWSSNDNPYYWPPNFLVGLVNQDLGEWDDDVVDVFIQLATLGDITYG